VLVSLQGPGRRPVFYVVPWNHVAAIVYIGYHAWLRSPGRGGSERRAHTRRTAAEREFKSYREGWELLDADADNVPDTMLPDWVWGWYDDIGAPTGHPGLKR
jgi:hypothetical protein